MNSLSDKEGRDTAGSKGSRYEGREQEARTQDPRQQRRWPGGDQGRGRDKDGDDREVTSPLFSSDVSEIESPDWSDTQHRNTSPNTWQCEEYMV